MSDGSLSQDEIDALLQGGDGIDMGASAASGNSIGDAQINEFRNFIVEIIDAQASNLSGIMGGKNITISDPVVELKNKDSFLSELAEEVVEINLDFVEGLDGSHSYVMNPDDATNFASVVVGQEGVELNEMALEAIKEAISQMSGSLITKMGDKIGKTIMPSSGESKKEPKAMLSLTDEDFVRVQYKIQIEGDGEVLLNEIYSSNIVEELTQNVAPATPEPAAMPMGGGAMDPMAGMGTGQPDFGGMMGGLNQGAPSVQPVQFPNLQGQVGVQEQGNIGLLMDVYMEMTVELGRTKKLIRDILGMGEGTIIELDKLAGEPVDILVNHKLIAKGEVVVIDENFGVRVTEIVSPMERMSEL